MNKGNYKAGKQQNLTSAVAHGNNLVLQQGAAEQSWKDLDGMHTQCMAFTTAPGVVLQYTRVPELMNQFDAQTVTQITADQQSIVTLLGNAQNKLADIKHRCQNHPARSGNNMETSIVAALDMSMEYNDWLNDFHNTVMVAVDNTLEPFRKQLQLDIPYYGGMHKSFHPSEVGVGAAPLEGTFIPKNA